jgi:glutamate/tyrosine decarboxylase-like PLP-dependent enzyme
MQFEKENLKYFEEIVKNLENGFSGLPGLNTSEDSQKIKHILELVSEKLHNNYPYHHPLYAGQMLKPPHPVARMAYMLAMWINPNNHALDGGRASSAMEKEAVAALAKMFGWQSHLGHLCSGGTMANLEALWIAGKRHPDKMVVASEQAHYTHERISEVLKIPFKKILCDNQARMDIQNLEEILKTNAVGTVVVNMGSTGTGSVDSLDKILDLQNKYHFRIHADAAYGGYYILSNELEPETIKSFKLLNQVDSIVVDPHKHGLQPYGCGCVLFSDPSVGTFYKHDSPYTYFSSDNLHLGEISLECSRPGASAVALWATQHLLPLDRDGEFVKNLNKSRKAALALYNNIYIDARFLSLFPPELDIVVWAPKAAKLSTISDLSKRIFHECAENNLHLAVSNFPTHLLADEWSDIEFDQDSVACLRSCLMKPEHLDWIDKIWMILDEVTDEVLKQD